MSKPWRLSSVLLALLLAAGATYAQERTPAPDGVEIYIITPTDGATLESPVTVRFGLRGMGVAPATGHHHLLVDTTLPDLTQPIPADDHHRHFGGGQTEVTLELTPGSHTLQLLLGDQNHVPHDPPVASSPVTITVR
jgi:hypothetical protein